MKKRKPVQGQAVKMRVGMRHGFIGFFGGGVEADGGVGGLDLAECGFFAAPIDGG